MKTIFYILQKEFIQIFRDKTMLPVIFLMPIVQLIILVNAATLEMKEIDMFVVDQDQSQLSRRLTSKFEGSAFFDIYGQSFRLEDGKKLLKTNDVDVVIRIPAGFEKDLVREGEQDIQLLVNAINGTVAGLINAYSSQVLMSFNREIRAELVNFIDFKPVKTIDLTQAFWYNPEMDYKTFMLPGILVILVTAVGMVLTAINLVREKEMGTIEQINVTPIRKYQFIFGKLFPFWLIALFELAFGLVIGKILYDIPFVGSLGLLFGFAGVYLFLMLGIALFISAISSTQQQVMFVSFFFLLVFILMSGIFTPVESMPDWAIKANIINPIAYFMKAIRMIMLKGSEFKDLTMEMLYMGVYGVIMLSLAMWRYKKVV